MKATPSLKTATGQRLGSFLRRATTLLALTVATGAACAAPGNYPDGPLTLIVPFSPGGGGDTLVRLYAHELTKQTNHTIVVDNKPGAGGNIGTAAASRAAPDGYTVVFGTNGTMGTNHWLYKDPGYSKDDFVPVARLSKIALALVVGDKSPYKNVDELIDDARKNPGKLTCASGGNGTASHIACALLQKLAKLEITHVPYKSGSSRIADITSGRVTFMIDVMPYLVPHIAGGNMRALAVSTTERNSALPNTPTLDESGVKGYEIFAWDGLFAPKGTPVERLDYLNKAVNKLLTTPDFKQAMLDRGSVNSPMSREDFAEFVQKEYSRVGEIVKSLGVTID